MPRMEGFDLASRVTTRDEYAWGDPRSPTHIIAYDFGIKRNILRLFEAERLPSYRGAGNDVRGGSAGAIEPDGVFLSNGPGDPAAVTYAPEMIRGIAAAGMPMFGICLGHQLLGLTFGGETVKMSYGHRGGNHPVKELSSGRVLITSQNHGFAVRGDEAGVPGAPELEVTHVNLNDGTVEGLEHREQPIFAVQYHPEAAPGPHDGRPLFHEFMDTVRKKRV